MIMALCFPSLVSISIVVDWPYEYVSDEGLACSLSCLHSLT